MAMMLHLCHSLLVSFHVGLSGQKGMYVFVISLYFLYLKLQFWRICLINEIHTREYRSILSGHIQLIINRPTQDYLMGC